MLMKAGNAVMTHYEGNPEAWQAVVDAIYMLFPEADMYAFLGYCDEGDYGLAKSNKDGVIDLMIMFDVDDEDDGGRYARKNAREWRLTHEGHLAKQMREGCKEWLDHHLEELEKFKQFKVRSFYRCNA